MSRREFQEEFEAREAELRELDERIPALREYDPQAFARAIELATAPLRERLAEVHRLAEPSSVPEWLRIELRKPVERIDAQSGRDLIGMMRQSEDDFLASGWMLLDSIRWPRGGSAT